MSESSDKEKSVSPKAGTSGLAKTPLEKSESDKQSRIPGSRKWDENVFKRYETIDSRKKRTSISLRSSQQLFAKVSDMVMLNVDDWINVLKNLQRFDLEKCQLVCRWLHLLVATYSKILPYYFIDGQQRLGTAKNILGNILALYHPKPIPRKKCARCVVYGMLEDDDWEWNEDELCGNLSLSNPNEYYLIRCRKTVHKQCMSFKITSESLLTELRRNLATTHARKFIFRRLTVTCALLDALESVFFDLLHCEPFKTFKFDQCTMADEILERPTLLDKYQIAKNFNLSVTFDKYAKFIPLVHKKAVQLADKLFTCQLEPSELYNFAFGINYELRKQNHNFWKISVAYLPLDNNVMDYLVDALLKLMEDGSLEKSLECCPFSECLIHIEPCGLQNSEVSRDLPIFQQLVPYSTKYVYDDEESQNKEDFWSYKHQEDRQPLCVVEALAFPDKSTKVRAVLHLWWLYIAAEEDYRLFQAHVIIQNKEKKITWHAFSIFKQ